MRGLYKMDTKRVINGILKLKEKRKALKKTYEEADEKLKTDTETLEKYLKDVMRTVGTSQLKCPEGIAFMDKRIVYNCKDWGVFLEWARKQGNESFLQKRLSHGVIQEFVDQNKIIPPGLEAITLHEINVRKN